jgi:Tfp pilus assembly protein PilX
MTQRKNNSRRRGVAAVLAMMFLMLMATLTLAMFSMTTSNVQTAENLADVTLAQSAAETGVRWMAYRFVHMARPKTTVGNITSTVAATLWPTLRQAIVDDISNPAKSGNAMLTVAERPVAVSTDGSTLTTSSISTETSGATFVVKVADNSADATILNLTSTGTFHNATRTVTMNFKIDKKIKYAVVGKVPVQLGRNTIVEGDVAITTTTKYPPIQMLSDFQWFDSALATKEQNFESWLKTNHTGYDGRVSVNNPTEFAAATKAGYSDYNGDGYIDEYDLFVKQYDRNGDKQLSTTEFTNASTGQLYDSNLFKVIDDLNGPMFAGDPPRDGLNDNIVDNRDGYAKIRGTLTLAMSSAQWTSQLSGSGTTIGDYIQGPITPTDPGAVPVTFSADTSTSVDLDPADFEQASLNLKAQSGSGAGSASTSGGAFVTISNRALTTADTQVVQITTPGSTSFKAGDVVLKSDFTAANSGLATSKQAKSTDISVAPATEKTPFGSTTYQATYLRPVFKNVHFKNVQIPQGMNALFQNCTFDGVTYIDNQRNITNTSGAVSTDPNDGKTWAQTKVTGTGSFSNNSVLISSGTPAAGQMITDGSKLGNNLRFDNCTFDGPLAGDYATAYTHFANSWEFTGATTFNNQWIDPSSGQTTATIISPQVNIEMGSFTNPGSATSTLLGVVVAGNIDIRGTSYVDGSIIITGDGAGNTTLGYFGPDDSQSNPSALPTGGYGQLDIRYNPYRALPDGINISIDVLPVSGSYSENVTRAN